MQNMARTFGDGLKFLGANQTINVPVEPGNRLQTDKMSILAKGKEKWHRFQLETRVSSKNSNNLKLTL